MTFIKDLQDGSHIVSHYFCKDKQQLMTKTGKDYLKLTLEDKTGVINAMVWDIGPQIGSFEKGDIIKIDAKASVYNDALQLTVSRLRRSQPGEYQVSDFFRNVGFPVYTVNTRKSHGAKLKKNKKNQYG